MTDQDALPTLTATFPLWRHIMIREGIEIVHAHQATSVMANESVVYAAAMGLPSVYTDHSLFQFDDIAGVVLNRVSGVVGCNYVRGSHNLKVYLPILPNVVLLLSTIVLPKVLQTTMSTLNAAICVSHGCRDNLILRAHLDPTRTTVIPNAVDPSKFTPDPSQRSSDR